MRGLRLILVVCLMLGCGCATLRNPLPYAGVGVEAWRLRGLVLVDGSAEGPVTVDQEILDHTKPVISTTVGPVRVEIRGGIAPTVKIGAGLFGGFRGVGSAE